ncbi:MAG: hypothetical protein F4Z60_10340, partial [Chloroflexi bacterium]|nr:hypothetical protein [Chloroflexota bacterium]
MSRPAPRHAYRSRLTAGQEETCMSEIEREGRWWSVELNRRTLLRGGVVGGVGLAAAALIGCGGDDDDDDDDGGTAATTQTSSSGSTGTTTVTSATQASQTQASGGDDDADDAAEEATEDTEDYSIGKLVRDDSLPYPYQFPEPNKQPVPGGRMQVAATYRVQNFDPTTSAAGGTITVPNYVYNRLLGMKGGPNKDPFLIELEPELASSWERTPDGQVFTFTIRDDVHWQNIAPLNGRQFVAEDAKFAVARYGQEGVHQSYWRNISSTEAVDGAHLSFDTKAEYCEREVLLDGHDVRLVTDQSARLAAFRVGQLDYGYSVAGTLGDLEKLLETNPDIQINHRVVVNGGIP